MVHGHIDRRRERGASGFFVAVILIFVAVAVLAAFFLSSRRAEVDRSTQVAARFARIDAALVQFIANSGRFPCPADPTDTAAASAGKAVPETAATAASPCSFPGAVPDGIVPWRTIGLAEGDSIDPWGGRISYRPYPGGTLDQGASLVNCDSFKPVSAGVDPTTGVCRTTKDTLPSQFLAGKGLTVNNFGTSIPGLGYVLVSHGPTGFGAYLANGVRKDVPSNPLELANFSTGPAFNVVAASSKDVAPGSANHFDDILWYRNLADVIHAAGLDARDWPNDAGSTLLNATTLGVSTYGDLGRRSVTLNGVTVGTLGPNIALMQVNAGAGATPVDGLGIVVGGTAVALASDSSGTTNGYIGFAPSYSATSFSISLAGLGMTGGFAEGVRLEFLDAGFNPVKTVTEYACRADPTIATFTVDAPAFRYVVVTARPSLNNLLVAGPSSFLVSDASTCAGSTTDCRTHFSGPLTDCGGDPPS